MRRVVFLRSALRDLDVIAEFSRKQWGETRSHKTLALIKDATYVLGEHPKLGTPSRVTGVYQRPVPRVPFIILYQVSAGAITIVAIVHTSRRR